MDDLGPHGISIKISVNRGFLSHGGTPKTVDGLFMEKPTFFFLGGVPPFMKTSKYLLSYKYSINNLEICYKYL